MDTKPPSPTYVETAAAAATPADAKTINRSYVIEHNGSALKKPPHAAPAASTKHTRITSSKRAQRTHHNAAKTTNSRSGLQHHKKRPIQPCSRRLYPQQHRVSIRPHERGNSPHGDYALPLITQPSPTKRTATASKKDASFSLLYALTKRGEDAS